jgi:hypothetical protein
MMSNPSGCAAGVRARRQEGPDHGGKENQQALEQRAPGETAARGAERRADAERSDATDGTGQLETCDIGARGQQETQRGADDDEQQPARLIVNPGAGERLKRGWCRSGRARVDSRGDRTESLRAPAP